MKKKNIKIGKKYYSIDSSGAIPKKESYGIAWKLNNQYHRIDGPAYIEDDGYQGWYQFGKHHREDGPAQEWKNGSKAWWYRGQYLGYSDDGYSQEDFEKYVYLLKHPQLKFFQ